MTSRKSTGDRGVPADARDLTVLQHAQQVDLDLGRHVADLVEEQRALVGELDLAAAAGHRAGERAPLVAEQLALQQPLGEGAAVHHHERAEAAVALGVDEARDSSLPVPLSPVISTLVSVGATCSTSSRTLAIGR